MSNWSRPRQLVYRWFHLKPYPLRQGKNGPYIFIHINKTAGTSIGTALGMPVKHHQMAREVIARIGQEKWNSAFKFTLVRNPWDKAVSLYEYRKKKNRTEVATRGISFADWVKVTYGEHKDHSYYEPRAFQPQVDWLRDNDGKVSMDFIGKFESINKDFDHIRQVIGLDAELPHLNAVRRSDYRSYYDDETREIVAHWFLEDIKVFGYEF